MKPSIGIVVPFFNTPMWIQTSIWCLVNAVEKYRDRYSIEILVVDNAAEDGIRGLKKTYIDAIKLIPELNERVTILKNPEALRFHGTALDAAVRYFNTDYLLCWESDIAIYAEDWLDWIMAHIADGSWMSGYEFTDYTGSRDTIVWYVMPNPGVYRLEILKQIDEEVRNNKDFTYFYGQNYSLSEYIEPSYQPGVFSERRGFKEVHYNCPDGKGKLARPSAQYYENGQWLFYKMMRDSDLTYNVLPQNRHLEVYNGELCPAYSDFGPGKFRHYWAGTRSWDFLIHPEQNRSQINYVRPKIQTEIDIWKALVPLHIRKIVPDVFNTVRNDEFELSNLRFIGSPLAINTTEWYKKEFLDTNFMNLVKE